MWSEYELHAMVDGYDEYGNKQQHYELIGTIDAALAVKTVTIMNDLQIYQKNIVVGTTPCNLLEHGKQYKLIGPGVEYVISSFVKGRICSLQLVEVP